MTRKLPNREIVKSLRRWSKRLEGLADDFERRPRKTRSIIDSITVQIKFNEKHVFPKITKI